MVKHRTKCGAIPRALICAAALTASACVVTHAESTWIGESGGSNGWTRAQNWSPNGAPDSNGNIDIIMAGVNRLTPDVDEPWDIRSLTFNNTAGQFNIGGLGLTIRAGGITNNDADVQSIHNTIRLGSNQTWAAAAGPLVVSGSIRPLDADMLLTVDGAFNSTFSGNIANAAQRTVFLTKNGAGTLVLSGGNNIYTGDTIVNGGTLRITESFRTGDAFVVANGAKAAITPRTFGAKTLQVQTLRLGPTATLDLADNDLVVENGVFTTIRGYVTSGFGQSTGGITSSTSNGSQILALFDNALVGNGMWNGEIIQGTAIVGKYTYFGDVNIDGKVTGDDYTVVDANLNTTPPAGLAWIRGDMNLDGNVTGDDYTVIDARLGLGVGNPLAPAFVNVVPEPAISLLPLGASLCLRRRRRRDP